MYIPALATHNPLKRKGRLVEPPRTGVPGSRRALRPRPYAVRKPKQYGVFAPGDLVEVDTVGMRPIPGVIFIRFTARDIVSRWDVSRSAPVLALAVGYDSESAFGKAFRRVMGCSPRQYSRGRLPQFSIEKTFSYADQFEGIAN